MTQTNGLKIKVRDLTRYAIYLYLVTVMINGSTGNTAVKIVRVITFLCLMLYLFQVKALKIRVPYYVLWSVAFLAYNIILCFHAYSKTWAVTQTWTVAYVVIVDVLVCIYLVREEIIVQLLKVYIIGSILTGIYIFGKSGLLVFLNSRSTDDMSANTIGFQCAMGVVLSIYFYLDLKRRRIHSGRKLYIAFAIVSALMVLLSASRKALVFMGVPLGIMLIMKSKNLVKVVRNTIIICVLALLAYFSLMNVPFLYELIGNRIEGMIAGFLGTEGVDGSTYTRLRMIEDGWGWFLQRKWFGYGLANFGVLNNTAHNFQTYAHNNYIEILVDCGIVGAFIYYQMYVFLAVKLWKKRRETLLALILFGCLISFIIGEYGMVTYYTPGYQFLLLLMFMYVFHSDRGKFKVEAIIS